MVDFLPEKLLMLDCEMTGVVPTRDALLQVALVKLKWDGNSYQPLKWPLVRYLKYTGKPTSNFHKTYLKHIFRKCNKSNLSPNGFKNELHEWLGDDKGNIVPTGDCVKTDLEFLYQNDCIDRPDVSDDGPIPGSFHYESFDLNPLKCLARQKIGKKEKIKMVDIEHDALADCLNQTEELNYYVNILLRGI